MRKHPRLRRERGTETKPLREQDDEQDFPRRTDETRRAWCKFEAFGPRTLSRMPWTTEGGLRTRRPTHILIATAWFLHGVEGRVAEGILEGLQAPLRGPALRKRGVLTLHVQKMRQGLLGA